MEVQLYLVGSIYGTLRFKFVQIMLQAPAKCSHSKISLFNQVSYTGSPEPLVMLLSVQAGRELTL